MSLALVASRALIGVEAPEVTVEVHLGPGLPCFNIVGLPDAGIREAKDRVRAALNHARYEFPARRITVNLAPADLPKDSSRFDLPIALGILAASGQLKSGDWSSHEFAGELSLTGELRPIRGALAMSVRSAEAGRAFVLPQDNAEEAGRVARARVLPARTLLEVCAHLVGREGLRPHAGGPLAINTAAPDLADVRGQAGARFALEVAAAGCHSLLMIGPPGTGKSMLAARLPGLLPAMSEAQALESAAVQSVSRSGFCAANWGRRPFRSPHHGATGRALAGGGNPPRPGEISLAHHGVLFLDELPEFSRDGLEALREPMETGSIILARAAAQVTYPARFQLVAAMNPCPCGHLGSLLQDCRCTPDRIARYRSRLSGPLLDRIDIRIDVPALAPGELLDAAPAAESSAVVRERVARARAVQLDRQGCENARLAPGELERQCDADAPGRELLVRACARLHLSARGTHRVLALARTIADLGGERHVRADHIAQAIQMRRGGGLCG